MPFASLILIILHVLAISILKHLLITLENKDMKFKTGKHHLISSEFGALIKIRFKNFCLDSAGNSILRVTLYFSFYTNFFFN